VAYARPQSGEETAGDLALAAVVVHNGKYNATSQELVRKALIAYYKARLSEENKTQGVVAEKGQSHT
jgi:hypothetical protein